ncbi:MAG: Glu-tRNA(Gln) amidotransferase subunit GatD [Candidatus Micrarchaeota archaeon]
MYSPKTSSLLKEAGVEIGDKIRIECDNEKVYHGIVMPRAGERHTGESEILVIKLDSGYNIGIKLENAKILLLEKGQKKKPIEQKTQTGEKYARGEIAILGCGGTIVSKVDYRTGAVYSAYHPDEIIQAFPKIKEMASIYSKLVFPLYSEDMRVEHWKLINQAIADEIKIGAKGIVIMHGTDTIAYTAAAASFALQNLQIPVVFTAAQRSSDRPSSDNETNLYNSIFVAKSDIAHVGLCMHAHSDDDFAYFHLGTKVRKMHTSRRDAFQSINASPLAKVDYKTGNIELLVSDYNKRDKKRVLEFCNHFSENVGMLYIHPGFNPKLVDKFADYDGIVLVGTGLGHVPTNPDNDKLAKSIVPNLKALIDSGVSVVMSSQTIYGRINMNVYTPGRILQEIGVIGNGMDWTPETAYVKLCWVLGKEKDLKKIKELMIRNIASEISSRTIYKE